MGLMTKLRSFVSGKLKTSKFDEVYMPNFRIVEILLDDTDNYIIVIQVRNKSNVFQAKPEELLENDEMINQFSPRDVRTLSYLGYLDIKSPKYKILAKRFIEKNNKFVFALKKRGEREIITKTADQLLQSNEDIISNMHPNDAHVIAYTIASEDIVEEKKYKELLSKDSK